MKRPRHRILLSSLFLFTSLFSYAAARLKRTLSGWSLIKNLNDADIKETTVFAVKEYTKRDGTKLKPVNIIRGWQQVVEGFNYRLDLATKDGSKAKNYEAVIFNKPWRHFRNLTSFTPLR